MPTTTTLPPVGTKRSLRLVRARAAARRCRERCKTDRGYAVARLLRWLGTMGEESPGGWVTRKQIMDRYDINNAALLTAVAADAEARGLIWVKTERCYRESNGRRWRGRMGTYYRLTAAGRRAVT